MMNDHILNAMNLAASRFDTSANPPQFTAAGFAKAFRELHEGELLDGDHVAKILARRGDVYTDSGELFTLLGVEAKQ